MTGHPCSFAVQKYFKANYLSRDHFDSEICRRFMGLSEAAAIAVMEGLPRKQDMVRHQGHLKFSLEDAAPIPGGDWRTDLDKLFKRSCSRRDIQQSLQGPFVLCMYIKTPEYDCTTQDMFDQRGTPISVSKNNPCKCALLLFEHMSGVS